MKNYENLHTFVICTYKDSPYLEECLLAISKQTVKSSIIISTSTPTDKLRQLAKKYGIKIVTHDQGGSIGKDWNYGFAYPNTKYVTITHQDDIYLPSYAEKVIERMERYSDSIMCFTNYSEIDDDTHIIRRNKNLYIKDVMLAPMLLVNGSRVVRHMIMSLGYPICSPTATYNMEYLKGFRFSETVCCAIDWEAYTRINSINGRWIYLNERLVQHRIHRESVTSNLIENNTRTKEEIYMFEQYWPKSIARMISKVYVNAQKTNDK